MAKLSADNVHSCSALSLHGMQDLHSSAQASQLTQQELHNVTGNTSESSSAYTAYPNADLQNYLDLEPPAGTSCCMLGAANVSCGEICDVQEGPLLRLLLRSYVHRGETQL